MKTAWKIAQALAMALWGHRNQRDKQGRPYWRHVVTVAWLAYGLTHKTDAIVVGLLHDYLEDVDKNAQGVIYRRFGYRVFEAVRVLTNDGWHEYKDYARNLQLFGDELTVAVKMADLLHNTKPGRSWTRERAMRYQETLERLSRRRSGLA